MTAPDPATVADQARQHSAYAQRNGDDNAALLAQCADVIDDLLGQLSDATNNLADLQDRNRVRNNRLLPVLFSMEHQDDDPACWHWAQAIRDVIGAVDHAELAAVRDAAALAAHHAAEQQRFDAQVTNWRERALHAETRLRDVELLKVWTNEDRKGFVFADDLANALGVTTNHTTTASGDAE